MDRCECIGLHPAIGIGCHLKPADGVFAEFLRAFGIPEPPPLAKPILTPKGKSLDWWTDLVKKNRGRSSLRKWACGCQNVRVGTQEFNAQCLICGNEFVLAEEYEANHAPTDKGAKPTSRSGLWVAA